MSYGINRVAVIGAGTMGAAIAAHCANAGVPVYLLDAAPDTLTPDERTEGPHPRQPGSTRSPSSGGLRPHA